jgi:hypothetical protein
MAHGTIPALLIAAVRYFAAVFCVGFLVGPIRVFWLEPWLGKTVAVLCETPVLLVAMVVAARWATARLAPQAGLGARAAVGVVALLLQQIADFAVGTGLRGIPPAEQLAYLATPAGLVYGAALLVFATMPILVDCRWRAT